MIAESTVETVCAFSPKCSCERGPETVQLRCSAKLALEFVRPNAEVDGGAFYGRQFMGRYRGHQVKIVSSNTGQVNISKSQEI